MRTLYQQCLKSYWNRFPFWEQSFKLKSDTIKFVKYNDYNNDDDDKNDDDDDDDDDVANDNDNENFSLAILIIDFRFFIVLYYW